MIITPVCSDWIIPRAVHLVISGMICDYQNQITLLIPKGNYLLKYVCICFWCWRSTFVFLGAYSAVPPPASIHKAPAAPAASKAKDSDSSDSSDDSSDDDKKVAGKWVPFFFFPHLDFLVFIVDV